ncbi:Yqey-like protein-domain-containing protein [Phyllosticta citribraziliensis]|uniref:Altered inheritance of mitochondria protein 41 n=1 Tax=Phyllosticta citribraziliensis TaxID=989973 RepID=A0ABR1LWU3_9PEZI
MSFALPSRFRSARLCFRSFRTVVRAYSAEAAPSPIILPRLREDMKTAMRSKDTVRLSVVRAVLADITNASHSQNPVESDDKLRALLLKKIHVSSDAVSQFREAKRQDLVDKEQGSIDVMHDYVKEIEEANGYLSPAEIEEILKNQIASMDEPKNFGAVMKIMKGPQSPVKNKLYSTEDMVESIKKLMNL